MAAPLEIQSRLRIAFLNCPYILECICTKAGRIEKEIWRQGKRKLFKTCLRLLFQITASSPLPSPRLPHAQLSVWVYVVESQVPRWRTKLVIGKFVQTYSLFATQTWHKWNGKMESLSLSLTFSCKKMSISWMEKELNGLGGQLHLLENSLREECGSKEET